MFKSVRLVGLVALVVAILVVSSVRAAKKACACTNIGGNNCPAFLDLGSGPININSVQDDAWYKWTCDKNTPQISFSFTGYQQGGTIYGYNNCGGSKAWAPKFIPANGDVNVYISGSKGQAFYIHITHDPCVGNVCGDIQITEQ